MRTDEAFTGEAVVGSDEWRRSAAGGELDPGIDDRLMIGDVEREGGGLAVHSLSGKERNHLFLNGGSGKDFADISALSGMDSASDARCFVLTDYDRDGWQDLAVVNANQPLMQLFHNDIAQIGGAGRGMIAIRFVGGNATPQPSKFASRDGYGAMVEVSLSGGVKLKREHRCGEGYAAQNSATMIVGIGDRNQVDAVSVRWPSGEKFSIDSVAEGTLLTAFENRAEGAFTLQPYRRDTGQPGGELVVAAKKKFPVAASGAVGGGLRVYTTTATWCAACRAHLPALAMLKQEGVALYGVPIDPDDDEAKLAEYVEQKRPPYQMLAELRAEEKRVVTEFLAQELQMQNPVLPSSVITDRDGNVLEVMAGIPTRSQIRKWK